MAARTIKVKFDGDSTGLAQATSGASATLERFDKATEETRRGMDRVGEGSENLADSSSLATGALGALASGFELVGLDGYAESLQKASLATDFMSGVGDSLTLVTQKLGLAKAKDAAVTAYQATVTGIAAAKAAVMTGAQWALNAAMSANPIMLVVLAVAALVAAFVIAYKKSDTFRAIVQGAFNAIREAAGWAVDFIRGAWGALVEWLPAKVSRFVELVAGLPGRIGHATAGMFDGIKDAFRSALNWLIGKWNGLSFTLPKIDTHIPGIGSVGGFTLSTPDIGYLATGGYGQPGRTYLTGEYGPELVTFGPGGGHVTPNNQLAGGVEVRVFLGDQELRGMVRTEITASNRDTVRRARAGTGAYR